eukprot:GHVT01102855.1.p1 GENE.GHVT01102855.1~~GHVT01102855.1.p1  ORF type:complete len:102 (-),score=7.70 GHVT01102855.1:311-616(-)
MILGSELMARIPQVIRNLQQGHTGRLSWVSFACMTAGNLARVFTTSFMLDDPFLLTTCVAAAVSNGIPTIQILWYRDITRKVLEEETRRKEEPGSERKKVA